MATLRNVLTPIYGRLHRRHMGRYLSTLLILFAVVLGLLLAISQLHVPKPDQLAAGQQLAWAIAQGVDHTVAELTTGSYLPGNHIVLYTKSTQSDRATARQWAMLQLEPYAKALATLADDGQLTWIIDLAGTPPTQEVVTVSLQEVGNIHQYEFVSFTAPTASAPLAASADLTMQNGTDEVQALEQLSAGSTDEGDNTVAPTQPPSTAGKPLRSIHFEGVGDDGTSEWHPVSGSWETVEGVFHQQDMSGYDYITLLDLPGQSRFQMSIRLRMVDGEMGGGLIYNAPSLTSRVGAQIVDMDDQGRYLRWGNYDADGAYVFQGGASVASGLSDGEWHTLQVRTDADRSIVLFDGKEIGRPLNRSQSGYLGLVTSRAQVDFDDLIIEELTADGINTTLPSVETESETLAVPTGSTLQDDFANGNINRWRVLNGTWQFTDGTYQQSNVDGSDLGAISIFRGANYRISVRTRLLEGSMGAGLYFNMAERDVKMGSQMVSYTADGKEIQWGSFDDGGNFVFQGSAPTENGGDGAWHTLTVDVIDGTATISADEVTIADTIPLTYASGYVGLFVNHSSVAFDDLIITPLASTGEAPIEHRENEGNS